jgi:hypothetical protein
MLLYMLSYLFSRKAFAGEELLCYIDRQNAAGPKPARPTKGQNIARQAAARRATVAVTLVQAIDGCCCAFVRCADHDTNACRTGRDAGRVYIWAEIMTSMHAVSVWKVLLSGVCWHRVQICMHSNWKPSRQRWGVWLAVMVHLHISFELKTLHEIIRCSTAYATSA